MMDLLSDFCDYCLLGSVPEWNVLLVVGKNGNFIDFTFLVQIEAFIHVILEACLSRKNQILLHFGIIIN